MIATIVATGIITRFRRMRDVALMRVESWRVVPTWCLEDGQTYATSGAGVRVTGITANLPVADIDAARGFYTDYLGLGVEGLDLGWVARFGSPDGRARVQLVTRDATSPQDSVLSVHVGDDVDEAYAEAQRRGYEIVHPLTEEPWGVRRFFVRDPDGNVINIVSHRDE
jgi:predicted enzyme related to lactoylglutathione lyase